MDANKNCGGGGGDIGPPSLCHLKFFHFLEFFIPGFEKMDTKEQGYWKDFSEAILDLTRPQKKFDLLWAFQSLNRAILDLYEVVDLPYPRKKKVEFYSGYVIHYIVLIDAIKGPEFKLSYQQEDIQDPYDKSCLIRMAKQITGLFMDHQSMTYGGFFLDNTPNFYCSTDTDEELSKTMRRLLRFIMGVCQLPLRLLAAQHKNHYFGRQPASE